MAKLTRSIALAAGLALAPLAVSAASIDPTSNLTNGGTFDILAGPYFYDISFSDPDTAGTLIFNFANNSATARAVSVSIGTVLQSVGLFTSGVTAAWTGGAATSIAEGVTSTFSVGTTIAAGGSDTLTVTYGDPTGFRSDIDLTVQASAVPVPAAGLLLLTGLGGIAALRRRKSA